MSFFKNIMVNFTLMGKSRRHFSYLIVLVVALSGFLFGYNTGVISGVVLFLHDAFYVTAVDISFIVSAVLLGACISSAISGRVADYCGRRKLMLLNAIVFVTGAFSCAMANNAQWLTISRLIVGFAIGMSSYVAPLFISEMATFSKRGVMVGLNQLFVVTGILVAYLVDYGLSAGGHWRLMFTIGAIPGILLLIGLLLVPESPRWLMAQGKEAKARDILLQLRDNSDVELEVAGIKENIIEQRVDWRMLFKPWLLPVVIIGFGIAALQQLVGINIFIYYGPTLLAAAGFKQATSATLATVGMGVLLEIFTIMSLFLIDTWGRRPLLLLGSFGMLISLVFLSIVFGLMPTASVNLRWLVLGAAILYIASFAISFGPIGWLMVAEMFPLRIRGFATSLATAMIWLCNMLVSFSFLPLVQLINFSGVFLLYALLCLAGILFVYYLVPETKNITLEHIETNLRLGRAGRGLGG